MAQRSDSYEIGRLGLTSGQGRRVDLYVHVEPFEYAGSNYTVPQELVPVQLDISRTTGDGWALRLRFSARVDGPCMRCLELATPEFDVDSYEVHQPGAGVDLVSPYLDDGDLDLQGWARDALALALPTQIICKPDCAGLCQQCGANLNDDPDHVHEAGPDPRWGKLSELKFEQ